MKRYLLMAAVGLMSLTSCEDFLDTESYTKQTSDNFPASSTDVDNMVTGVYSVLNTLSKDFTSSNFWVSELASDDRFGGGGANDKHFQAPDHLLNFGTDMLRPAWIDYYMGIYRANSAMANFDKGAEYVEGAALNSYKGQVHFLRAFYVNEMAELWGSIPLPFTAEAQNLPKTDIDVIYGHIAYDLKEAIGLLPATRYSETTSGRVTKWAAEAMMARVFLFYTGFYQKAEMPLGDGAGNNVGSVTKAEVINWIDDCVANSGHSLVNDYRRLWPYSNEYTAKDYDYVKDLAASGNVWLRDGENPEHVFVIKCSSMATWSSYPSGNTGYGNLWDLSFGVRAPGNGDENTYPFGRGWGAGPASSDLWDEWKAAEPLDPRREASIISIADDYPDYVQGADRQMEDSQFWQKKYMPIMAHDESGKLKYTFGSLMYGRTDDDFQIGHPQDLCVIRYADVLLMQSELKENADGLNAVRNRVGLPNVSYSTEALRNERRWELAFEGRRWADIRRWHIAEESLRRQLDKPIYNDGVKATMKDFSTGYAQRYQDTKGGFFKIPESEIDLSSGVLTQNEGWTGSDSEFTGW